MAHTQIQALRETIAEIGHDKSNAEVMEALAKRHPTIAKKLKATKNPSAAIANARKSFTVDYRGSRAKELAKARKAATKAKAEGFMPLGQTPEAKAKAQAEAIVKARAAKPKLKEGEALSEAFRECSRHACNMEILGYLMKRHRVIYNRLLKKKDAQDIVDTARVKRDQELTELLQAGPPKPKPLPEQPPYTLEEVQAAVEFACKCRDLDAAKAALAFVVDAQVV